MTRDKVAPSGQPCRGVLCPQYEVFLRPDSCFVDQHAYERCVDAIIAYAHEDIVLLVRQDALVMDRLFSTGLSRIMCSTQKS